MKTNIKFRITIFASAIALLVALIAGTAHLAWRLISDSHQQLATVQWKSFEVADHLQQSILNLNNCVLRYAAYGESEDWTNFDAGSKQLNDWINDQQPLMSPDTELPLLDQISTAYRDYRAAAIAINTKIYSTHRALTRLNELGDFETQSKRILDLGFKLAAAHQVSLETFRKKTLQSLEILRVVLFLSLVLLSAAGCWLASVVYREMISPLQVQLVESQHIVERQEKLASLGMLAAGVAHEIRNPLTAIKAWLYLQQKHLKPGTPEFSDAEIIGAEINRLERIVKDFLQFARPSEPEFKIIPVHQPLNEVRTLMEPQLEKSKIKLEFGEIADAQIRVDPQQIKQVLINLVQNAADSIGKNGTITMRARLDEKWIKDKQTEVAILEVHDTGKGISPEAEKRLFDPFFTTKDFGTGLGLPIAARIVEKHLGALQYQTQADYGTTFGIILPLHK